VAACRTTDRKISKDIRQELNIFKLGGKVKEYQHNYLEHILRMPTNLLPRKHRKYGEESLQYVVTLSSLKNMRHAANVVGKSLRKVITKYYM
jgi:hypothetical protein